MTRKSQRGHNKSIRGNSTLLPFPHTCGNSMISACTCSLIPISRMITGSSLPRKIAVYTCCTCGIISIPLFDSYYVLVWMIYGKVLLMLTKLSSLIYLEKNKELLYFSFSWFSFLSQTISKRISNITSFSLTEFLVKKSGLHMTCLLGSKLKHFLESITYKVNLTIYL